MAEPLVTTIIVSFNTKDLTLRAIETLLAETRTTPMRVVVIDNQSKDGSAEAIETAFPEIELIRSGENLGFARANNVVAETASSEWLLLLNPDTEVLDGAVDKLMAFARAHPDHGIYGGRTVFADRALNPGSCWNRMTPWSTFCSATGLTALFRSSEFFNPEGFGGWKRDTVREVDIVQGSFFLIRRAIWEDLGGFDLRYFMYGEEADLCLRAKAKGWRPVITPEAEIIHLAGAASPTRGDKQVLLARGRAALIRDHWPSWQVPFGLACQWLSSAIRVLGFRVMQALKGDRFAERAEAARMVWVKRAEWMQGY
jgi:GT2 family glycosyltransferase